MMCYLCRDPVWCLGEFFDGTVLLFVEPGGSVLNSTLLEGLFGVDVLLPLLAVMLDF